MSDEDFLQAAIDGALVKPEYRTLKSLNDVLLRLLTESKEQAIAEIAQRILRSENPFDWPSPRGENAVERLRQAADTSARLPEADIENAISRAEQEWEKSLPAPWNIVSGKWILSSFVRTTTEFKRGSAFLETVAARNPRVHNL